MHVELIQAEADALIEMDKHRVNDEHHLFPMGGQAITVPVQSPDRHERFLLDFSRGRINLAKIKMQNRARQVIVLVRLDIGGAPHRNPDGEEIARPHVHRYREGYADKWAVPVSTNEFSNLEDISTTLREFMAYCHVTRPPLFDEGLFT